jgi:hypothetical protein
VAIEQLGRNPISHERNCAVRVIEERVELLRRRWEFAGEDTERDLSSSLGCLELRHAGIREHTRDGQRRSIAHLTLHREHFDRSNGRQHIE